MRLKATIATIIMGLLSACGDMRPLDELNYADRQKMLAKFTANCTATGVNEKSSRYIECVQTEINAENAKRARQRNGLSTMGAGLSQAGANYSTAAQQYRPVTCTTSKPVGWGSATTRCY